MEGTLRNRVAGGRFEDLRRDIVPIIIDMAQIIWSDRIPAGSSIKAAEPPYYIIDDGRRRTLELWNGHPRSMHLLPLHGITYSKACNDLLSTGGYPDYFLPLRFIYEGTPSILNLGLGGGSMPDQWRKIYGLEMDSVEVDPKMIELAQKFIPETNSMNVINQDGVDYVAEVADSGKNYDIIMQDVAVGYGIPKNFLESDFIRNAHAILSPDGVLAVNYLMALNNLGGYWPYVRRLGAEFNVYRVEVSPRGNVILLGTDLERDELVGRIERNLPESWKEYSFVESYRQMKRR
jgi:hypothetical protein